MSNTLQTPNRPIYKLYQEYNRITRPQLLAEMFSDDEETSKRKGPSPDEFDETYTACGAIMLKQGIIPIDLYDGDQQIFAQDEPYVGFHLRPLEPGAFNVAYLRQSFREVTAHLIEQEVNVDEKLAAVTYARLGQTASMLGFEVSPLPVMAEPVANPDIEPVIVHQRVGDFIEMYP